MRRSIYLEGLDVWGFGFVGSGGGTLSNAETASLTESGFKEMSFGVFAMRFILTAY